MDSVSVKFSKFITVIVINAFVPLIFLGFIGLVHSTRILSSSEGLSGAGEPLDLIYGLTVIIALVLSLISSLIGGLIILPRWIHADPSDKRVWSFLFIIVGLIINYLLLSPPVNLTVLVPRFVASLKGL